MIDVSVNISGIALSCDESVLDLNIGNGYSLKKMDWDIFPHKTKVTDGCGNLILEYEDAQLVDKERKFVISLIKHDDFQIDEPVTVPGVTYSFDDLKLRECLDPYKEREIAYLYEVISLLHLFHGGNIGFYEIFFEYSFRTFGVINTHIHHKTQFRIRNVTDRRKFALTKQELMDCNHFLTDNRGRPFKLLQASIDEFIWGMNQIDIPTGFEQYTTALEMTLLEKDAQNKKKMLANRVAILIGSSPTDITQIHANMLSYYRFRSESLHEGSGANISITELYSLEEYVRSVLKKCLLCCKQEIAVNPAITWEDVKQKIITDLKMRVVNAKSAGILPM